MPPSRPKAIRPLPAWLGVGAVVALGAVVAVALGAVVAVTVGALVAVDSAVTSGAAVDVALGLGVLVGTSGMTLYTFDKDESGSGKSVCNGNCAALWPPLMATADAKPSGEWSVVTRDDGAKQWAYKGKPLYYWVKDAKPGEKSGDGVNNVWRIAQP